jgi:hypothetical protein
MIREYKIIGLFLILCGVVMLVAGFSTWGLFSTLVGSSIYLYARNKNIA